MDVQMCGLEICELDSHLHIFSSAHLHIKLVQPKIMVGRTQLVMHYQPVL